MHHLDLRAIFPKIDEDCEKRFQEEMEESGGKRCIISSPIFNGIDLRINTLEAQVVLNCLTHTSCPISTLRFAASLYPYRFPCCQILSYELSQIYMLEAIETIINLRYDKVALESIEKFQLSKEFKAIMQIADEMLERLVVSSVVCSEVHNYIKQHAQQKVCSATKAVQ